MKVNQILTIIFHKETDVQNVSQSIIITDKTICYGADFRVLIDKEIFYIIGETIV